MKEYHKIQSLYKRDPETKYQTFLLGQYTMPEFEFLKDNVWVATEKIDGTNIRVHWDAPTGEITFGGRTERAQIPAPLVNRLNELFTAKSLGFFPTLTLYGEGFGAGIQKGGGNYGSVDFILFDVVINDWWLERSNVSDIAEKLNIKVVPVVGAGSLKYMEECVKNGFTSLVAETAGTLAEGVVLRPEVELFTRGGERIITKLKYKDFNP